jgi:hypothetical protein
MLALGMALLALYLAMRAHNLYVVWLCWRKIFCLRKLRLQFSVTAISSQQVSFHSIVSTAARSILACQNWPSRSVFLSDTSSYHPNKKLHADVNRQ